MKIFLLIALLLVTGSLWSKNYTLEGAEATYTVKHIFKTVKGKSQELKGKMVCEKSECDFLVAAPAKSFVSSDSNRDLNMQTILETKKFPLVTVKGKFSEDNLSKESFEMKSLVNFHGVEKEYLVKISKKNPYEGRFVLLLEEHRVERPSLLTSKIDNEVPIDFSFRWKE